MKTTVYVLLLGLLIWPLFSFVVVPTPSTPAPERSEKELRKLERANERRNKLRHRLQRAVERRQKRGKMLPPIFAGTDCDTLFLFDGSFRLVTITGSDGQNVFYQDCPQDSSNSSERLLPADRVKTIRYGDDAIAQPDELTGTPDSTEDIYLLEGGQAEGYRRAFRIGMGLALLAYLGILILLIKYINTPYLLRALLGYLLVSTLVFGFLLLIFILSFG